MYMISRDSKSKMHREEIDLKNSLIISNPLLYNEIYGKFDDPDSEEFDIEEMVPETEEEVMSMLSDLKRQGIIS